MKNRIANGNRIKIEKGTRSEIENECGDEIRIKSVTGIGTENEISNRLNALGVCADAAAGRSAFSILVAAFPTGPAGRSRAPSRLFAQLLRARRASKPAPRPADSPPFRLSPARRATFHPNTNYIQF
ncbi:hypothetical protein EVAR_40713_1 [Eumeta japonica]|uniref:Uncharacterized protein n=1 Tax=Eumeta variegata TaxID=151549 RepID=A0A4C1XAN2_EUMVA|nr:hypothetical protein EVAR_40713_1 [Eumeta japonica]